MSIPIKQPKPKFTQEELERITKMYDEAIALLYGKLEGRLADEVIKKLVISSITSSLLINRCLYSFDGQTEFIESIKNEFSNIVKDTIDVILEVMNKGLSNPINLPNIMESRVSVIESLIKSSNTQNT